MNPLKFYQVADQLLAALENGIDMETGEILPELAQALEDFTGKGEWVAAHCLNLEASAQAIRDNLAAITARMTHEAQVMERSAERMREYLHKNMKRTGTGEIKASDGSFKVTLQLERDISVVIDDPALLPAEFMRVPEVKPAPDKTAIKAALKAGAEIPGAHLDKKDRLVIG